MRPALPLIAAALATGAAAEQSAPSPHVQVIPMPPGRTIGPPPDHARICTDRIHQVREERGLPELQRETAAPEPLLIAAVDHRIDGCSVMVMRYDTRDLRPVPTAERPVQLERIPER